MPKDLWYQLPADMNAWQSVIISNLARKVPEIPPYIAGLEFNRIDPVIGDVDGIVYLLNGMAGIPILVRNFRLAPLDVMVDQQENFYPVSGEFLNKLYADNVLAVPSDDFQRNNGIQEDGPARRIESIRTVDAVKRASADVREKLASAIEASPATLKLLDAHLPEVLSAIYATAEEKVASEVEPENSALELTFLVKESGRYFLNGEEVSAKVAGEYLNLLEATEADRVSFSSGSPVVVDYREKTAGVYMGESQGLGGVYDGNYNPNSPFCLATVVGIDGVPRHGIVLMRENYDSNLAERDTRSQSYKTYLYVGPDCHSLQDDMMLMDPLPMDAAKLHELSAPTDPLIGAFGIAVSGCSYVGPFEILGSVKHGKDWDIRTSSHRDPSLKCDQSQNGWTFYAIPREEIGLVKSEQEAMLTMPGENYRVTSSINGNLIIDGRELSYANGSYELMKNHGLLATDALKIASEALATGECRFKIAKTEAEKGSKNQQSRAAEASQQEAQFNPAEPAIQPNVPVQFDDIEDVAKINNPSLMSAYLTGKLVDVNTAGKEQMMQISDDVMEAIKSIGKLLFLIRMGSVANVSEEDAQMALNKMTDVAKAIGTAPIQMSYSG